jgi:hypothetical protein
MNNILLISTATAALLHSSTTVDPAKLFGIHLKNTEVTTQTETAISVLSDAKALNDFESVLANMPSTAKLDPPAITAMIESHKTSAKEKITEGKTKNQWSQTAVGKAIKDAQQELLDANKATKRVKDLEDEVERLRDKIESMRKQGKR